MNKAKSRSKTDESELLQVSPEFILGNQTISKSHNDIKKSGGPYSKKDRFERRYYERINDKTSLRKAEEIRKLFKKLWYREEEEVRALVSNNSIIKIPFKLEDPKNKK